MRYVIGVKEAPMFARVKKVGTYEYIQIVENHRKDKKSVQRVIGTPAKDGSAAGQG
jgi:hypothetical protein